MFRQRHLLSPEGKWMCYNNARILPSSQEVRREVFISERKIWLYCSLDNSFDFFAGAMGGPWCQDPSEALVSVMSLRWQDNLEATIVPLNWAFSHTFRILQGVLLRRNMWQRPVALWGRPMIFFQRTQTCFPECWRNQTRSCSIFAHRFCLSMLVCQAEKSSHMLFLSSFSQVCTTDK